LQDARVGDGHIVTLGHQVQVLIDRFFQGLVQRQRFGA